MVKYYHINVFKNVNIFFIGFYCKKMYYVMSQKT